MEGRSNRRNKDAFCKFLRGSVDGVFLVHRIAKCCYCVFILIDRWEELKSIFGLIMFCLTWNEVNDVLNQQDVRDVFSNANRCANF